MSDALGQADPDWIETFQSRSPGLTRLDLQPLWHLADPTDGPRRRAIARTTAAATEATGEAITAALQATGSLTSAAVASEATSALAHPWAARHRPDWAARQLICWPRGGLWWRLRCRSTCPDDWQRIGDTRARARLVLRWWADQVLVLADGQPVRQGDLFDTACRWELPTSWWQGQPLDLEIWLRSPLHDDGALVHSRLELEPTDPNDPLGLLEPDHAALRQLRHAAGRSPATAPGPGSVHLLGHAHLDLAWLWPVADTWQAAERTFGSVLELMQRFEALHFGHSTPALYAWLEEQRPALFERIRAAMRCGRWEPLNGPWVETDAVLISTASLLRQFQEGQLYSRSRFPEWPHQLAWLPDSFGFAAGLPPVAQATGVRWFCTHKLAWNATNPFPHRLFRWRGRCGAELLALMTAPIGSDGDPQAIERERLAWQARSGVDDLLWLPGMGDHGGGPTAEMLEQLQLWEGQPDAARQRHGSLRQYLAELEPLAPRLPVWRDELYLELHRGCATSRPDQKRHNRSLERLLREADLACALLAAAHPAPQAPRPGAAVAWRTLLFHQFHDILPGTSIPEVFDQAEPQWRAARRQARRLRDGALAELLGHSPSSGRDRQPPPLTAPTERPRQTRPDSQLWQVAQLQPLSGIRRSLRLPQGAWELLTPTGSQALAVQPSPAGGCWVQLPVMEGVTVLPLRRSEAAAAAQPSGTARAAEPIGPVTLTPRNEPAGRWRLANDHLAIEIGPEGIEQLRDGTGEPLLAAPLRWQRWRDAGEYWDAWDLAADHRQHPLPWEWEAGPEWLERGPLCAHAVWRGRCGRSRVRLDARLLADTPWLELVLSLDWRQRHELLQLDVPLARPACRWASDTSGGVIERPAAPRTPAEQARWEAPAISWVAAVAAPRPEGGADLALLLDGPQGVSATPERLSVSLLRAPTWPDPGADNGWQRQRLALMPCPGGWRPAAVPAQARRLREPLWRRPSRAAVALPSQPLLPALPTDLDLVQLRPCPESPGQVLLSVQNLGPCRRRLEPSLGWQLLERLDGLDAPLEPQPAEPAVVRPWELAFWRMARVDD